MMIRPIAVLMTVFACCWTSVTSLKCHEGIDMNLNGIPINFWQERECSQNSKCIEQQMSVDLNLGRGTLLHNTMRYGSCMNSAYGYYLNCENLFGANSTLDPAELLDMLPSFEGAINKAAEAFAKDMSGSLTKLLSNGTGVESFIAGSYHFLENFGFNLEEARPLESPLAQLLKAVISGSFEDIQREFVNIIKVLGTLQTVDEDFSTNFRQLITRYGVNATRTVDEDYLVKIYVDKIPGLVRSVLPESWQLELWYDVALKMVGDIDPRNWTRSAENISNRIKKSYNIPVYVQTYVYPFLDRLPDLAGQLQVNPNYIGNWSLGLLKHFGEVDYATTAFSTSVIDFIEAFSDVILPYEIKATIRYTPGLLYKIFPEYNRHDIEQVFTTMADGFNSFDFKDLSNTVEATPLSNMIINLIERIGGTQLKQSIVKNPRLNALIVNFAKMFTDLMKVKEDYTPYVTDFVTVVDNEFKKWPNINVGRLITDLITKLGGEVPDELVPFLNNVQGIINVWMQTPYKETEMFEAILRMTSAYMTAYPKSPFPELADRYITLLHNLSTLHFGYTTESFEAAYEKSRNLNIELQLWNIDLQFAIIRSSNYEDDELYRLLIESFPEFGVYIRVMKAMNPEDVKQLIRDVLNWLSTGPVTVQGFVDAVKPSFAKITYAIKSVLGDIRRIFSPNTCKFGSCDTDLCNTRNFIEGRKAFTKSTAFPPNYEKETTSAKDMPTEQHRNLNDGISSTTSPSRRNYNNESTSGKDIPTEKHYSSDEKSIFEVNQSSTHRPKNVVSIPTLNSQNKTSAEKDIPVTNAPQVDQTTSSAERSGKGNIVFNLAFLWISKIILLA